MNKLQILGTLILATSIGCTPQLKPNPDIYSYYVTPGSGFSPTQLCGVSPSGEACLRIQDGPKVKKVIYGSLLNWLPSLQANETTIATSGRDSFKLPKEQAAPLLEAIIADSKQRESERRMSGGDRGDGSDGGGSSGY